MRTLPNRTFPVPKSQSVGCLFACIVTFNKQEYVSASPCAPWGSCGGQALWAVSELC